MTNKLPSALRRLLLALALLGPLAAAAQDIRHVVLISIDGLRPEFYQDSRWPAPRLQALARQGASADGVVGVFPSATYPSHTSLVTGVHPARHGIFYNTAFEPAARQPRWFVKAGDISARTLWDAVRQAGLTSAAVSWPVSAGAPIDFNLPEIWLDENPTDRTQALLVHAQPRGLFEEVQQQATGALRARDLDYRLPLMDAQTSRMLAYLIRSRRPALAAIHLVATDAAQHADGLDSERVHQAVATVDHAIGTILDALREAGLEQQSAVIVVGDHGFANVHLAVAPNVWLAEAGLLTEGPDWQARFHVAGGSAFLHLRQDGDGSLLRRLTAHLQALPAAQRRLFRLIEGAELQRAGADPRAALALSGTPGVSFVADGRGELLRPASGGNHGYSPELAALRTGFVAHGPGIRGRIAQMDLVDVAPTIARLLGLTLPAAEGKALPLRAADKTP